MLKTGNFNLALRVNFSVLFMTLKTSESISVYNRLCVDDKYKDRFHHSARLWFVDGGHSLRAKYSRPLAIAIIPSPAVR